MAKTDPVAGELLERLVRQFASPYDFVREVVQNAMDGGTDVVDVVLHTHAAQAGSVFELEIADQGEGMDETIIDGELTKLFSSSKRGDRTMAGGFGIGFVSVFAWEPDLVLLQTGRHGEAWELVFYPDYSFEKHRLEAPLEGTTLRLLKRGPAVQRDAIADAVRDSLWRWCRYVPIEVSFEDATADDGPQLVRDVRDPDEAACVVARRRGETEIRLAFDVPPRAVLLRRGLVLAEGSPADLLPGLARDGAHTPRHLQAWCDSPLLRPTLARDKVVDDAGREAVGRYALEDLRELRAALLGRAEHAAAASGPWTPARHARLAHLHAHVALEAEPLGAQLLRRAILRRDNDTAISPAALRDRARHGIVLTLPPGVAADPPIRLAAARAGLPVIVAEPEDRRSLRTLLGPVGLSFLALASALTTVELDHEGAGSLCSLAAAALRGAGLRVQLHPAQLGTEARALLGAGLPVEEQPASDPDAAPATRVALVADSIPTSLRERGPLFIESRHPVYRAAAGLTSTAPRLAALSLATAIAHRLADAPTPTELADALLDAS